MASTPRPAAKTTPAAARRRAAATGRSLPLLPPVTVARFEEALALVEQLVDEQTDVFIAKAQDYRERHRNGTERALSAAEAVQIAAGLASAVAAPPVDVAVALQQSDLRAYDEPEPVELLMRAGVATAPAFMGAVQRFVALIEMPADTFRAAREAQTLEQALTDAATAMAYEDLDGTDGARARAARALEHFTAAAGASPGKAWSLLPRALWQAVQQATSALGLAQGPSSLIGSAPNMDGLGETSSTTSPTSKP
jgi:hypothetical protein